MAWKNSETFDGIDLTLTRYIPRRDLNRYKTIASNPERNENATRVSHLITAIKQIREDYPGCSLRDAKDIVEFLLT